MFQDNDLAKIPNLKSKDAVNNFLKTASKLTSIEENSEMSSGSEPTMRQCDDDTMRPVLRPQKSGSSRSSMSTSPSTQSTTSTKRLSRASDLPTLGKLILKSQPVK